MLGDQPDPPPVHWVAAGEDAWVVSRELMSHGYPEKATAVQNWTIEWFESLGSDLLTETNYRAGYARILYENGRLDEAENLFSDLVLQVPDSVSFRAYLGSIAARRGNRERAMAISDSLVMLDRPFRFGSITFWQARIAAVLGERELAVSKLQQAFDEGYQFTDYLHRDEDLHLLRGYEPFEELLRPKR